MERNVFSSGRLLGLLVPALLLGLTAGAGAQSSLCTTFLDNNGQSGNMFDVTPSVDLTIDSFDINSRAAVGSTAAFDFYYRVGTSFGFETDPTSWTFVGNYAGVSAGRGAPTNVSVAGNGITFQAGQVYGIYLDAGAGGGLAYTNGGPATYSNAELSIQTNCGNASSFGSVFFPRQWNGCVYYSLAGGGMVLGQPVPGIAGVVNSISVTGAPPRVRVYIATGFLPGQTAVPPCPGLFVDILNADKVGGAASDASGNATASGFVNAGLSGRTVLLQAVVQRGCQVSNLVTFTFP